MAGFGIGDVRVAARGAWLLERIVATGSVVLREVGETRAGEMAAHRYLSSPYVSAEAIVDGLQERTASACAGRRIVAVQDTTEINFAGRSAGRRGLGPGSDGTSRGFFIHPVVAVDAEEKAVLGLVHAQIWSRQDERVSSRRSRPIEDKESARWIVGMQAAAERLSTATEVVGVSDQEGDIYAHFARRPPTIELVIRARHDRPLSDGGSLFAAPTAWPTSEPIAVQVAPRGPGDKGRIAQVIIRAGTVTIKRPDTGERRDPKTLTLGLVNVSEENAPPGVKPLLWRLLTTLPVDNVAAAAQVVQLYRLRWRIEEVFRACKSDGLRLEETQLRDAERLFCLAALALGAAVRTLQLVDARDGGPRPMSDVLAPEALEAATIIGKSREGATPKQQNPHPRGSLAWLSWIVARFGGWNCYGKPPGPKTMAHGWEKFAATLAGFLLATHDALP
jgi:hypothetical protein